MKLAVTILILALTWAAITGNFSGLNLVLGGLIAIVVALLFRSSIAQPTLLRRVRSALSLAVFFLWELMVSAVRVALVVLTPDLKSALRPAIVAFPLTVKSDAEITLLASLITLTPGTLSVDVSDDRSALYVHVLALSSRDTLIAEIAQGFEARVRELHS